MKTKSYVKNDGTIIELSERDEAMLRSLAGQLGIPFDKAIEQISEKSGFLRWTKHKT